MVTAAGAIEAALAGLFRLASYKAPAIVFTIHSPNAPIIMHRRRPHRSTIRAEMMVPTIPIVLRPPARPFCLREE